MYVEWFDILFFAALIVMAIYWIMVSCYRSGFNRAVQAKRTRLTEQELDRVTLALLGKKHNPSPDVDWHATRSFLFSQWRSHVRAALLTLDN